MENYPADSGPVALECRKIKNRILGLVLAGIACTACCRLTPLRIETILATAAGNQCVVIGAPAS
jgi:hypothetical protein